MDSASAIICWKDKILLFLRDDIPTIANPNCWSLPGGVIEKGETPLQALKRELIEEVSYSPKKIGYLGNVNSFDGFVHLFYSFIEDEEAVKFKHVGTEGQKICFYTLKDMEKIQLTPRLKERLIAQKVLMEVILKEKSFEKFKL